MSGFTWPKGWLDTVLPRRKGGGALGDTPRPPRVEADAGSTVFVSALEVPRAWWERPGHDPELRDTARRCVEGERTPASVAALLGMHVNGNEVWACVADHLLAAHGPVFAARTVAELAGVHSHGHSLTRFTGWPGWDPRAYWAPIAERLRIRLAGVPDADHVRVVAALAEYRHGVFPQRVVASYLVPDQAPWVAADCADAVSLGARPDALLLFGAASTAEQFRQVTAVERVRTGPATIGGVATLLDVLGTDAVPVLELWADARHTKATLEPIWVALAALPSDAALEALVRRESARYAAPVIRRVMKREPERATRALAAAGSGALLREHAVAGTTAEPEPVGTVPVGELPPWTAGGDARVPKLPTWLDPRLLRPLRVPDGRALPPDAVRHVCTVLAMSTLDTPHAGLDEIRAVCDPVSLESFVWAMVDRWADAGYPAKERWVYTALGPVGGDDTVSRLVPLLERWPSRGAQARAVLGLDILGAVGTGGAGSGAADRALMHLDRFTRTAKTPTVRAAARERVDAVARARGLTPERLADRLVPDFGLGPDGRTVLDYGPRRFVVGFDERLRPFVTDGAGKPLKTLPKPGAKDHPDRAPAAYSRFAALKSAVRTVAAEQVARFETAMVRQRRWPAAELATLFVAHPLLRHLVRRLVWVTAGGASFRVAEDGTYADVNDDPFEVPTGTPVGVAHPLHLGTATTAWAAVFADYAILQPFPQLARETYDSTAALDRFVGRSTTSGRALGLRGRGWQLDDPRRGHSFRLDLPGDAGVSVRVEPGVDLLSGFDPKAPQTVRQVTVYAGHGEVAVSKLDRVSRSEVLRDLERMFA